MNVDTLIQAALNCCKCNEAKWRIEDVSFFYNGYAERGYTTPESGIIATGNWNTVSYVENGEKKEDDTPRRLEKLLTKMGVSCEWSDEWIACSECNKLVRTSPDGHGWTPSYEITDSEVFCSNCIDPVDYLSDLEGNWKRCNHFSNINPTDYGYKRLPEEFEHGLHHGQDASPAMIAKALRSKGVSRFVFSLDEVSQFDIHFCVFVAEEEFDEMLLDGEETDGPSPSEACMKALQGLSSSEK